MVRFKKGYLKLKHTRYRWPCRRLVALAKMVPKVALAVCVLTPLTWANYRARERGLMADEWFWADRLLVKWELWDLIPK